MCHCERFATASPVILPHGSGGAKSDACIRTRSEALQTVAAPCATVWGVVLCVRFPVLEASPHVSVRFSCVIYSAYVWCDVVSCCGSVLRLCVEACGVHLCVAARVLVSRSPQAVCRHVGFNGHLGFPVARCHLSIPRVCL